MVVCGIRNWIQERERTVGMIGTALWEAVAQDFARGLLVLGCLRPVEYMELRGSERGRLLWQGDFAAGMARCCGNVMKGKAPAQLTWESSRGEKDTSPWR